MNKRDKQIRRNRLISKNRKSLIKAVAFNDEKNILRLTRFHGDNYLNTFMVKNGTAIATIVKRDLFKV